MFWVQQNFYFESISLILYAHKQSKGRFWSSTLFATDFSYQALIKQLEITRLRLLTGI